jgi:hypothetical protein
MKLISAALEYFLHGSTWKGLSKLLAAGGILSITVSPAGVLTASGLIINALINVFLDDSNVTKSIAVKAKLNG